MCVGHEVLVAAGNNSAQLVIIYQFFRRLPAFAFFDIPQINQIFIKFDRFFTNMHQNFRAYSCTVFR